MTQHQPVTVAVIGAGMAGLIAARELQRRGIDVVVLESASRPGGRMLAETTALGSRVDLGGQWIGHGHHRFEALAAELGTTVFAMRTPERPAIVDGAATVRYSSPAAVVAIASVMWMAAQCSASSAPSAVVTADPQSPPCAPSRNTHGQHTRAVGDHPDVQQRRDPRRVPP
mgnify:CR=1 FL=1